MTTTPRTLFGETANLASSSPDEYPESPSAGLHYETQALLAAAKAEAAFADYAGMKADYIAQNHTPGVTSRSAVEMKFAALAIAKDAVADYRLYSQRATYFAQMAQMCRQGAMHLVLHDLLAVVREIRDKLP